MKLVVRLLMYSKKYWGYLAIAIVAIVGLTATQLYAPMVVRELTQLARTGDPTLKDKAFSMGVTLFFVYLLYAVCQFVRSYFTHYAAWKFVAEMRVKVYDKLQNLSLQYYHDKQTGQLMSRVMNDTGNLELLVAHSAPDLIVNVFILIGVTVMLFIINPVLAALSLVTVPFLVLSAKGYATKVLPFFRNMQKIMGEMNATLQDSISGMREIQVFNQQEYEKEKVKMWANNHVTATLKALKYSATYHALVQFLSSIGTVLVIGYGGYLASTGAVPIEDIVAFILYLGIFYQPIATLARVNEDIQTAIASAERVIEVLDAESDVKEVENPITFDRVKGEIKFDNVSFHYIDGVDVLKDINIWIKPGNVVALVGPTGVGKTTFTSLINRFYDTVSGDIYIDNVNIKDVSLRSLRDNISIVLQDIFLFNGTVAENIAYGRPDATREQIIAAAKTARAHEFIMSFENGYDTMIGERGLKLSGGQKQRLSIARAVLRDKPILILDEATASVDVETEKLIQEALDEVMKNRTTIIIAHRLSTIKKANNIIVLKDSTVEEIGTHSELVKSGGLYSHLSGIQMSS